MDDLQSGQQIGPYRLMGQIGQGGMATVFKAYQSSMDRYVALKVLPREFAHSAEFRARFQQEARVIANLEHAHILPVYDFGENDGVHYFVMRLLEAGTLKDRIRSAPLSLDEIDELFTQLADALGYAHARGIIHRDIKPSNVLIDQHGDSFLTDFGIAKILEGSSALTGTGTVTGTPDYMSPEQGRGEKLDQRSDIYSLGVVLYEMVTGRTPFEAETPLAVILKHMSAPLPLPTLVKPDVSPVVERVILKALAKDRQDRFASCQELVESWKTAVRATKERGQTMPMGAPPTGRMPGPAPTSAASAGATYPSTPIAPPSPATNWMPIAIFGLLGVCLCGLLLAGASSVPFIAAAFRPNATASEFLPTPLEIVPTGPSQNTSTAPTGLPIPTPVSADTPSAANPLGTVIWSVGSEGTGPGEFDDARYVGVDGDGNIYVAEHKEGSRVQVFDSDGDFVTEWQPETDSYPSALAATSDGKLYYGLFDDIHVYDGATGEQVDRFDVGGASRALTVTPDDELYVITATSILHFDDSGSATVIVDDFRNMIDEALSPSGLAVDEEGNIYVVGNGLNAILKFSPDGSEVTYLNEGEFLISPQAIAVDDGGNIYVAGVQGVQVYDSESNLLGNLPLGSVAFSLVIRDSGEGPELYAMDRNSAKLVKFQLTP